MEATQESRVRTTDDDIQVWKITTATCLNVDDGGVGDGDSLGFQVDFETLPHTVRMTEDDLIGSHKHKDGWHIVDREYEGEHLVTLMGMYFDTEFDRSAGATYAVTVDITWELESFG